MNTLEWKENISSIIEKAKFLTDLNIIDVNFSSGHSKELYVAAYPWQKSRGLSMLSSLDVDGMLFVYTKKSSPMFTMEKMLFDLDFGWYDENGKSLAFECYDVGFSEPISCPHSFTYVIEAPKGTLPRGDILIG